MKKFNRVIKLLGLLLLIVLASVGVGIGGGVPVRPTNKKEDTVEVKIELLESKDDKTELTQLEVKQ